MLKKLIIIGLSLGLLFIQSIPLATAQENLFDTLDDIKEKVEGDTGRLNEKGEKIKVDLIDFSEDNPWGNLPKEVITKLKAEQIKSLEELAKKANYKKSRKNIKDLKGTIAILGFVQLDKDGSPTLDKNGEAILSDEGNLILNEIVYSGESQIRSVAYAAIRVIRNLIGSLAIIWMIITGIQMVMANGDDSKITQAKQSVLYIVIGLGTILLFEQLIYVIYGVPGAVRGIGTNNPGVSREIMGMVSFLRTLLGGIVMFFIVISGFKTITAAGEEDQLKNERNAIMWSVIGVMIVLINQFVVNNIFVQPLDRQISGKSDAITTSNVQNLINLMGSVIQFLLGFVGLIAFAGFVYAGISIALNYGNDEQVEKSKKLMINALIGIVIILSAFAIVSTLIKFG